MHGRRDMVVPFRNALENYKAAPRGLGRLAEFPDRGHYGLPDSPKYWEEAVGFILSGGRVMGDDGLSDQKKLELIVDDRMWTLPKYRELLFLR